MTSGADSPRPNARSRAEKIYRLLLHAYPSSFRADYGRDMTQLFRDQWREGSRNALHFWCTIAWDVAQSAPHLRLEAWRGRVQANTPTMGVIMKIISILTVLLGLFTALSAVGEVAAGSQQGALGTAYLLAIVLGAVAGGLLLTAGVAALRDTPSGRRTASRCAIASLVAFLVARLVFGWMSIFAQLVGIVLPIAIIVMLYRRRRAPEVA